jgi:hypothetical protein
MRTAFITIVSVLALAGCATESTTKGVAWGAGLGAVAGGIYGGHGSDALIGAAIGAGVGYLIGNEQDKKKAQQMSETSRSTNYSHNETGPFANTSWRLQDWSPKGGEDFRSKTFDFGRDGWVKTTTTHRDGRVTTETENYRVVGNTLIVNRGDYLVNYRFSLQGNTLTVDTAKVRAVLVRI